jgi:hypothetical protein
LPLLVPFPPGPEAGDGGHGSCLLGAPPRAGSQRTNALYRRPSVVTLDGGYAWPPPTTTSAPARTPQHTRRSRPGHDRAPEGSAPHERGSYPTHDQRSSLQARRYEARSLILAARSVLPSSRAFPHLSHVPLGPLGRPPSRSTMESEALELSENPDTSTRPLMPCNAGTRIAHLRDREHLDRR